MNSVKSNSPRVGAAAVAITAVALASAGPGEGLAATSSPLSGLHPPARVQARSASAVIVEGLYAVDSLGMELHKTLMAYPELIRTDVERAIAKLQLQTLALRQQLFKDGKVILDERGEPERYAYSWLHNRAVHLDVTGTQMLDDAQQYEAGIFEASWDVLQSSGKLIAALRSNKPSVVDETAACFAVTANLRAAAIGLAQSINQMEEAASTTKR